MSISPRMQKRLEKIENLVEQGYELKKTKVKDHPLLKCFNLKIENELPFVSLKDPDKRDVNLYTQKPAGFSWVSFFFYPYLLVRIRDYSYFYWYAVVATIVGVVELRLNTDTPFNLINIIIGIMFGYQYPYLRYIAKSKDVRERGWTSSICLALILTIIAVIPNLIITASMSS